MCKGDTMLEVMLNILKPNLHIVWPTSSAYVCVNQNPSFLARGGPESQINQTESHLCVLMARACGKMYEVSPFILSAPRDLPWNFNLPSLLNIP